MRLRIVARLLCVALVAIGAGCATARLDNRDEWRRPVPRDLGDRLYRSDEKAVFPVIFGARESAVSRLAATPFVRLSLREAEDLAGHMLPEGDYFLIRGVCIGCGTGSFKVHSEGENVLVSHVSLAGRRTRPTLWPVVVSLDKPPGQVFVEYSAAE